LVLARHPALHSVGLTALLGISFSLLATLLLVPACMDRVRRWQPACEQVAPVQASSKPKLIRARLRSLYRYQGPYVAQFIYWKTRIDPLCAVVDAALPTEGQILDLGCGFGLVAHWLTLSAPARRVVGVDQDTQKIQAAQATARYNPRVSFEAADVLTWDYPPCDHVVCGDLLHYFPRPLKLEILRKAWRAIRPGGRLVLRDACHAETKPHRAVVRGERWAVWAGLNKTDHGLHFESLAAHLDLLREAGFSPLQTNPQGGLGSNLLIVAAKIQLKQNPSSK
jgi:2-polyprenyl-3-methyl-5-hydroxy-6-metoxy-1,4-benzoquinol methylase